MENGNRKRKKGRERRQNEEVSKVKLGRING